MLEWTSHSPGVWCATKYTATGEIKHDFTISISSDGYSVSNHLGRYFGSETTLEAAKALAEGP